MDGISLDAQRGRISSWCEATGTKLAEIITDAGISGTRPLADRPGGARIASLLTERNPEVETVVVARLDRLGRDAAETLTCLRQFAKGSVGLVSVADRLDLSTPQGRALAQMGAVFAELERALIASRTSDALRELRSQGKVYGSLPYGYARVNDRLVPDEAEQQIVARIQAMRRHGHSYDKIARTLNGSGVPAKRGGNWSAMSVRSITLTAPKVGRINAEVAA
jgi:site-specific DNA recombinase